ncbi:hypothetical protein BDW68DRAFT_112616 [Aspergillus falconensis]
MTSILNNIPNHEPFFGTRNQSSTRIFIQHYHSPSGNIKSSIKGAGGAVLLYSTLHSGCRIGVINDMDKPKVIEAKRILFNMGYGWIGVLFLFCMGFGYLFICIILFRFSYILFRLLHPSDFVSGLAGWLVH